MLSQLNIHVERDARADAQADGGQPGGQRKVFAHVFAVDFGHALHVLRPGEHLGERQHSFGVAADGANGSGEDQALCSGVVRRLETSCRW